MPSPGSRRRRRAVPRFWCWPQPWPPAPGRLHPGPDAVGRLAEAMAGARRPRILAGRGAVLSCAEAALVALAERTGALPATTVCGHGLFAESPWSLGIAGGFSSPIADELISESDLIAGFGASFTPWTTKRGKLIAPGAVVAQIDIEAAKLGDQMLIQHAVLGDAKATAEALLTALVQGGVSKPRPGRRTEAVGARILSGDNHQSAHSDESSVRFIDPRTLSKAVDAILPIDRVVASDSGHFCGLGPALSARTKPARIVSQPFFPGGWPWPCVGHRPRSGQSRQARRARRRRRRLHDVDCGSRNCAAPEAAALYSHLQRQLLRRRGALLSAPGICSRHRPVPGYRLCRHCTRLRSPCRDGQDAVRS